MNSCNSTGHVRSVEEKRKKWTTYMSETKTSEGVKAEPEEDNPRVTSLLSKNLVIGIIGDTPIDGIPRG